MTVSLWKGEIWTPKQTMCRVNALWTRKQRLGWCFYKSKFPSKPPGTRREACDRSFPLDCKEIKPVHSKGNQFCIFVGRTDAEAEAPILWPPDAKNWLIGKDPDAGQDWRQEEKGMTKDELVGWHHQLDGHEFEQALGVGDGQGSLVCCNPWGRKVLDTTE